MPWTEDDIKKLKESWNEGHSTAEIGRLIGKSKNAVVGKAHRLKLASRPSPIKKTVSPKAVEVPKSKVTSSPKPKATQPKPATVKLTANANGKTKGPQCQWPYGHPDDPKFKFCQRPVMPGKPYCPEHCQIAYIPANRKGEAREAERRAQLMAAEGQKIGWASELTAAPVVPGDPPVIPRMLTAALDEDFSEIAKQDLKEAKAQRKG